MDIKTLAIMLLVFRIISDSFMLLVVAKQLSLVHKPTSIFIRRVRWVLFTLSIVIFMGNLVPIYVDAATIFDNLARSSKTINAAGIWYTLSNSLTAMLSAVALWAIYRLSEIAAKYTDMRR